MSVYFELISRLVLVAVFGASTVSKIRSRRAFTTFVTAVRTTRMVPERWMTAVGAVVAAVECLALGLLAWPATVRAGYAVAAVTFVGLAGVILVLLSRRIKASCACFGGGGAVFAPRHVARNVFLAAMAISGFVASPDLVRPKPPGAALAVVAASAVAALVIAMDDLVALSRRSVGPR